MKRTTSHRDVKRITAAIERAIASPCIKQDGVTNAVMMMILHPGTVAEDYIDWSPEAMRAVLLAYALHAPAREAADMARCADGALRWVEWWEREGLIETCTREGVERDLLKQTYARALDAGIGAREAMAIVYGALKRIERRDQGKRAEAAVH